MDAAARKAAVRASKAKKPVCGIYALRCCDGRVWVGQSRNLAAQQNQIRFALQNGSFLSPLLRKAWAEHTVAGFSYEVLECLEETGEDLPVFLRTKWLTDRERYWRHALGGAPL